MVTKEAEQPQPTDAVSPHPTGNSVHDSEADLGPESTAAMQVLQEGLDEGRRKLADLKREWLQRDPSDPAVDLDTVATAYALFNEAARDVVRHRQEGRAEHDLRRSELDRLSLSSEDPAHWTLDEKLEVMATKRAAAHPKVASIPFRTPDGDRLYSQLSFVYVLKANERYDADRRHIEDTMTIMRVVSQDIQAGASYEELRGAYAEQQKQVEGGATIRDEYESDFDPDKGNMLKDFVGAITHNQHTIREKLDILDSAFGVSG